MRQIIKEGQLNFRVFFHDFADSQRVTFYARPCAQPPQASASRLKLPQAALSCRKPPQASLSLSKPPQAAASLRKPP
jgi:hypothetical protein